MSEKKRNSKSKKSDKTEKRTNLNDYNKYHKGSTMPRKDSNNTQSTSGTGPRDKNV